MKNIKCFDLLLEPVNIAVENVSSFHLTNPESIVTLVNECYNLSRSNREKAIVVGFSCGGKIAGMHEVSAGLVTSTSVVPEQVFKFLLLSNATHFIILHNHPSGSCKFSKHDEWATERLIHCAKLMGMTMMDHIVVTNSDYISMRQTTSLFD